MGGPKREKICLSSSPSNSFRSPDGSFRGHFDEELPKCSLFEAFIMRLFPLKTAGWNLKINQLKKNIISFKPLFWDVRMLSYSYRVFWGVSRMIYNSISAHLLEYNHRALAARYASGISLPGISKLHISS